MTQPSSGQLTVLSSRAGGLLTLSLRLRCPAGDLRQAPLDAALPQVYAAQGFLSFELEDDGFSLRLTLPG